MFKNILKAIVSPIANNNNTNMQRTWYQPHEQQWTCNKCTFSANMISSNRCEMCSNRRDESGDVIEIAEQQQQQQQQRQTPPRVWKCGVCTLINNYNDNNCEACGSSKPNNNSNSTPKPKRDDSVILIDDETNYESIKGGSSWICKRCTYINDNNADKCEICGQINTQIQHERITTAKQWQCDKCSFKNKNLKLSQCEMCGFNRNLSSSSANSSTNDIQNTSHSIDRANTSLYRAQQSTSIIDLYKNDIEEATRLSRNIIEFCKKHRIKFIDDSFPPCDKSLFINPKKKPKKLENRLIRWLHPEQIRCTSREDVNYKWSVYHKVPTFYDIKQGILGNCWLLSALAVITEKPEIIQKILITKEYCNEGCYLIRLCHNGEWKVVVIDDLFPCDEYNCLLYSQATKKQLWVVLIEKALAKLNGSYEALIAGHTIEGLSTLTGYCCESIRFDYDYENWDVHERNQILWALLLSSKEAGFALGASCGGKTNIADFEYEQKGLLPNHAYSILEVREVHGLRLIRLRNPWGRVSWNGDWSEYSQLWTPELRGLLKSKSNSTVAQLESNSNNTGGIFWISFDDFLSYYCTIDICKIRNNWMEARMSGYFLSNECRDMLAYQLVILETTQLDISLFQKTNKNRRDAIDLDLCFIILRSNKPRIGKYITSSKRQVRKFITTDHIFEPGEYTIVPLSFNFWYSDVNGASNNNLYNLVIHGSKTFLLEQDINSPHLLADSLIELCINRGKRTHTTYANANIYTLSDNFSGLLVVAENLDLNFNFQVEIDANKSTNMVSTRQSLITSDSVPPLHRQILILLTHLESSQGYSIHYSLKFKLTPNRYFSFNNQSNTMNYPPLNRYVFALHSPKPI